VSYLFHLTIGHENVCGFFGLEEPNITALETRLACDWDIDCSPSIFSNLFVRPEQMDACAIWNMIEINDG